MSSSDSNARVGIGPDRRLSFKYIMRSLRILPMVVGIGPEKLLNCKSIFSKFVKYPIWDGMVLTSAFPGSWRCVNAVKACIEVGMLPVRFAAPRAIREMEHEVTFILLPGWMSSYRY